MKRGTIQALAVVFAFSLVVVAISPPGQNVIEDNTGVETVGEAEALGPLAFAAGGIAVIEGGQLICDYYCASDEDTTKVEQVENADAEQTKIDIYSSAQSTHNAQEVLLTEMDNYLSDSKEVALMVGKNAAIREYMNGSSEIQSEQAAKQAVQDYYAQRQIALIQSWNTSITHFNYLNSVADNESGISGSEWGWNGGGGYTYVHFVEDTSQSGFDPTGARIIGWANESVTLTNGSTKVSSGFSIEGSDNSADIVDGPFAVTVNHGRLMDLDYSTSWSGDGLMVRASNIQDSNYSNFEYLNFVEYKNKWDEINSIESDASSEIEAFVNSTYPEWEDGQINETELIDPYLGSREYSPDGDFESWALSTYSSLGLNSPANMSTFGSMVITEGNDTVEGILMSDGLPENGQFEVGETYNPDNLTGLQYVVTTQQTYELENDFTIDSMTTSSGENVTEVTYRNVTYETANLSEYQDLSQELAEMRQEWEERKQDGLDGGSGIAVGGFIDWLLDSTYGIPHYIISFLAIVFLTWLNGRRKS